MKRIAASVHRFKLRRALALALATGLLALAVRCAPVLVTLCRSTDRFLPWPGDSRVRYEPGAEVMAARVAAALPHAMATVEARQLRRFARAPTVYVCASRGTFASYGGSPTSAGYVLRGRLFLSPKPENTAERIPRVVTHELSHVHLGQDVGAWRWSRLPFWFSEGLAALVSDGAGAESVSEEEARRAIVEGRVFLPEGDASLVHTRLPSDYGLAPHLFYREAAMFLGDLSGRDPDRWRRLLWSVEEGRPLGASFLAVYGETLDSSWSRFVSKLKGESR
ncbi:MAG TPA: hypothetical protein VGI39_24780 [Polyangiaceae bacterium]